ncbi:hypothetical protein AWZ03_002764 [Drosophila navojoa]|uniref:SET domain-containing protein n=1 Tax=Drosophila navojoa TaxID=7232 RepID=A0A484BSF0_DRONA|nr:hypothetical protein AWZ03_002764 [Drosophila navojoa]
MLTLSKVFGEQNELVPFIASYKNELETVKVLHTLPAAKQQRFNELTHELLDSLDDVHDLKACAERSRSNREHGNAVYTKRSKTNESDRRESLLLACHLYTQAILQAENVHEELCLGYANRGMALQEFGLYKEAYDDCECALEYGYPQKLQHKLIMRQAHCAWQLGDVHKLSEHLSWLEQQQLNAGYVNQLEQLQQQLTKLQEQQSSEPKEELASEQVPSLLILGKNHKISAHSGIKGRHMVATQSIQSGDIIFKEQTACFVPLEPGLICQQCAASVLYAPIPCSQCHQRVVYCSRRCRQLNEQIHSYECAGYKKNLFTLLGVSHLALRMVLCYVQEWQTELVRGSSVQEKWKMLMDKARKCYDWSSASQGLLSLCMMSHLDKAASEELIYYALCANLLQVYLHKCTNFYEQLGVDAREDWDLLIAALILRCAGQLLCNGHVGDTILLRSQCHMMESKLWRAPFRLHLGQMHKFDSVALTTALNLPYLALCNHACAPSIRLHCDGRAVSCLAAKQIEADEEIFNCYTLDYRNSSCAMRQAQLQQTFKFRCKCINCTGSKPDEIFLSFNRYRCEFCAHIFVPSKQEEFKWWESESNLAIKCSKCQATQLFNWYGILRNTLEFCSEQQQRRKAYKAFEELDTWLLDYHSLKLHLAQQLIAACLTAKANGATFDDIDYKQLSRILDHLLAGVAAQHGADSMTYISHLTYLMDLAAFGKYKCSSEQLRAVRTAINYLPTDTKRIFVNYYNDFIEQRSAANGNANANANA